MNQPLLCKIVGPNTGASMCETQAQMFELHLAKDFDEFSNNTFTKHTPTLGGGMFFLTTGHHG